MPLQTRRVESGLINKGFQKKNRNHKTLRYVASSGIRTSVFTHYSHGALGKEVRDGEVGTMARQCKVSTNQFIRLVSCELGREEYEALLLKKGVL